ncbi:protein phosphatase 2C domain-containing protein [Pseudomonas xantholysinigenes]|uniref:Protein phosphatase 2C domain-containing protein n=1 Tax=Pseudomonas xantholysinigenes TaxID=2745490 RepID=A0A9E6PT39_9PSED|nr:protein phosphatase 2C domain-containing protein [Pseudomonas xantholysinigenes]QXI36243.1 protein phosphatase 2C domain-containing protein [Pseudomonas xantholysinigenes]
MHFDLIQALSLAGKHDTPNDDRIGCADSHAWVIDGATDLGEPGLLGARGGAAWLAANAQRAFAGATGVLRPICDSVFEEIAQAYQRDRQRDPVAIWELPRAAFAAVALEGDELVCAHLADCVVLHRSGNAVRFLTPEPDREAEQAEAAALGPGTGAHGVRTPAVLADRRASRERPRAVLGVDAALSREGTLYSRVSATPGDDVLLMSDGFAALFDTYRAYDPDTFIARLHSHGLADLAQTLRAIEQQDAACLDYPRFKMSDDASAIWLRIVGPR